MSESATPGGVAVPGCPTTATITAAEIATLLNIDLARASMLLEVVAIVVEQYAPAAPVATKNEATVRGVAWLRDTQGAVLDEKVGPLSLQRPANSAAWFLHSGAASLLTKWKVRRGGAC